MSNNKGIDWIFYAKTYKLQNIITNENEAYEHYNNFGIYENKFKKGLKFCWPEPIFVVTGKVGFKPKVRENYEQPHIRPIWRQPFVGQSHLGQS